MNSQRQSLLQSIVKIIADYRQGEIEAIDVNHVDRWIRQFSNFGFDDKAQEDILREMKHILNSYYISRNLAQNILTRVLTSSELFGDNPIEKIKNTQFLRIQRKGNSQNDLLNLCELILQSNYGLRLEDCGKSPTAYIYLDDCLYTGNTALRDINDWMPHAMRGATLYLVFFAVHSEGWRYSYARIQSEAEKYDIAIKPWHLYKFHNSRWEASQFDCFWALPPSRDELDELINQYVQKITRFRQESHRNLPDLFRPTGRPIQERIFSSPTNRKLLEYAFLKAGAYIVSLPRNPHPSMKPLGYDYLDSLGFGAFLVTYRNIANNCPLALWWGDPRRGYPLNAWYPLFPRLVNTSIWEDF